MNAGKMCSVALCILSATVVSTRAETLGQPNVPSGQPQGCRIVANGAIEVQVFDDIGNGDEGDIIDAFKMKNGSKSEILIPENKRQIIWYKFRYLNGQRWYSKFIVYCRRGEEISVP